MMVMVPDAPVLLTKNIEGSSKSVISFAWSQAEFNGGKEVLDYRVSYDQSTGDYIQLETVTDLEYTT